MELKIKKLNGEVQMPFYANIGDAGFDLRSYEDVVVKAGEKCIVKTGIAMAIPDGYVGLIKDRSGMAAKHEMHVLAGVIDSGYRGEIGVVLKNLSKNDFEVTKNMRIAQMLIMPVMRVELAEADELDETGRGEGFGSSGTH